MTERENILRTIRFEKPERIPMRFHVNAACWHTYEQEALKDLIEEHPLLFPGYRRPSGVVTPAYDLNARADQPYTDPWGCVWETTEDGITGAVHRHPLENWEAFDGYEAPDPAVTDGTFPVDWEAVAARVRQTRADGGIVWGSLPHGHTFLRLQDLRGYENLVYDMADRDPRLPRLIEKVEAFNCRYVMRWMEMKPDLFSYPEDLGMQVGPMLAPDPFRTHIKPSYQRLMRLAQNGGCIVEMHSDGDIRTLAGDLVDSGVQVINLQDLVNGIDWIAQTFAGRVCVHLDLDRQRVTPFGTPDAIDALIREEVEKIGSPQGGLMMIYGLYPGVPLRNVKAVMDAMERYMGYYS
ncbi:MAG: uroporphyrinogen decarboxylase family protein [Kiritimatiellia bacterium]|nr:uroporphyrinogen decarboxylase family protein [Kiritimatiellia bacterium]